MSGEIKFEIIEVKIPEGCNVIFGVTHFIKSVEDIYEAFVNTACPRLSIEDQNRFKKPILLPMELAVALNRVSWEEIIRTPRYMVMEIPL